MIFSYELVKSSPGNIVSCVDSGSAPSLPPRRTPQLADNYGRNETWPSRTPPPHARIFSRLFATNRSAATTMQRGVSLFPAL
jgi:hypothetical protein